MEKNLGPESYLIRVWFRGALMSIKKIEATGNSLCGFFQRLVVPAHYLAC